MYLLLAILLALISHEGGHFLAAFCFGERISFRLEWGRIGAVPVPRGVWTMPQIAPWKQKVIALAGFGSEFIIAVVFSMLGTGRYLIAYLAFVALHFWAYPWYAGNDNDFKWL